MVAASAPPALLRPLAAKVADASFGGDAPCLLLFASDPRRCLDVAVRFTGGRFCKPEAVTVTVPQHDRDDGPSTRKAAVLVAYSASGGAALVRMDGDGGGKGCGEGNDGAAVLEFCKTTASSMTIEMGRRVIVLHGACRLSRQLQHALQKIVEAATCSALFVLTCRGAGAVDASLASRAVAVNCNPVTLPSIASSGPRVPAAAAAAMRGALDTATAKHRAGEREFARHHRVLLAHLSGAARDGFAARLAGLCVMAAEGLDAARLIQAAAEAEHASLECASCEPASRYFLAVLRECVTTGTAAAAAAAAAAGGASTPADG